MRRIVLLTFIFLFIPWNAFCVTAKDIMHIPPLPQTFDMAGRTLILQAKLNGTRNVNNKLKLLVVIDDKFLEVASEDVIWDDQDRPTYNFKIYYPVKTLKYNFVLDTFSSTGETTRYISRDFVVNRTCKLNAPSLTKDPVKKGFEESKNAERVLHVSEDVYRILNELKEKYEKKSF